MLSDGGIYNCNEDLTMILIDKPYVSGFLKSTLKRNRIPVIRTEAASELLDNESLVFLSQEDAVDQFRSGNDRLLYCNSENSISWIEQHLKFTDLPSQIALFKNKHTFRNLLHDLYPGFFYTVISLDQLESFDCKGLPFPFIIKPSVGFFSLGVYKVECFEEWESTLQNLKSEIRRIETLYPPEVLNTGQFIIEECIQGEEFAIDCYFNDYGLPVVLDILKHLFSSGKDVNDRVYITSKDIIGTYKDQIGTFLSEVGSRASLKNFPAHVEVRIDENGHIAPIEFNPMRFGGWCSTPDLAWHAWGMNVYEYFFQRKEPDWNQLLQNKDDLIFSNIVLNNSTGILGKDILSFDYDKLWSEFDKPLELRKTDFKKFPLFGFLFAETKKDNMEELNRILHSDLTEYIQDGTC
jgi:hypothetical protein